MSNPKLGRINGVGPAREIPRVAANSICPLPIIGWKPSGIARGDGSPDQPPLFQCLRGACAWYCLLAEPSAEHPQGYGVCAPAALAAVTGNLPAALNQFFGMAPVQTIPPEAAASPNSIPPEVPSASKA